MRKEHDLLGAKLIPDDAYCGGQSARNGEFPYFRCPIIAASRFDSRTGDGETCGSALTTFASS